MPAVVWLPEALNDLKRVYTFLGPKNLDAAARAVQAIFETANYHFARISVSGRLRRMTVSLAKTYDDERWQTILPINHELSKAYSNG